MTRTSVGRLQAENAPRPGLAEVIAVWTGFGLLALAILVTYARLPLDELYNVSGTGFEAGAGRVLVFAGFPTALVAIAVLAVVVDRLRTRWVSAVAVAAAILCATVAWPGVVEQGDLDAKPANALAAVGTLIALALTILALTRGGIGYRRSFGGGWDIARLVLAIVVVLAAIPWIAADLGFHLDDVPGLGSVFLTGVLRPEPGHPTLTAVHLGHHHGFDGTILALTAILLSRTVCMLRSGVPAHRVSVLRVADARLRPRERAAGLLARAAREARSDLARDPDADGPEGVQRPGRRSLQRLSSSISQPGA